MGRWTPEEDRRLLEMVARGKSWLHIAANLKRPTGSVRTRAYVLKRKASVRSSEDTEPHRKHKRRPRRFVSPGPSLYGRNEFGLLRLNPGSVALEWLMRKAGWTPSIVPRGEDHQNVYLVVDDLGRLGRVWREVDVEAADLETVIQDLLEGQYSNPVRVVSFNTAEKWSQDVSADVAHELRRRCDLQRRDVPFFLQDFVDRYEGRYRDVQLPLPMRLM
jgi:hypothetical protein